MAIFLIQGQITQTVLVHLDRKSNLRDLIVVFILTKSGTD